MHSNLVNETIYFRLLWDRPRACMSHQSLFGFGECRTNFILFEQEKYSFYDYRFTVISGDSDRQKNDIRPKRRMEFQN